LKTADFLSQLKELGIKLTLVEGQLKVGAPKGVMTKEIIATLKEKKEDLIAALGAVNAPSGQASLHAPPRIKRIARGGDHVLSFAQQRLWFFQQMDPGTNAYNIPLGWSFIGRLDIPIFERALMEVLKRHEVIRSYFPQSAGKPVQRVAEIKHFKLERVPNDKGLSIEERRKEIHVEMMRLFNQPFDLARPPIFRPTLFEISEGECIFYATVHHILFDGLSVGIFLRDLTEVYEAFCAGKPSPLTAIEIHYIDFSAWQRQLLSGPYMEELMEYWRGVLGGKLPLLDLPRDRPRPAVQTFNGAHVRVMMTKQLETGLNKLAQREGVTLYMLLLAAYSTLMGRYTGIDDIIVGSAINARSCAEVEEAIGFFANTMVLRTSLEGNPSFIELLKRTRSTVMGAFEHKEVPFERLVDEFATERNLAYSPIFQTLFLYESMVPHPKRLGEVDVEALQMDGQRAQLDITLWICSELDEFYAWVEYNTDLFNADRMQRMLDHLYRILESIVKDPELPIHKLEIMDTAERTQLERGGDVAASGFEEQPIHARFEAQVDATPDALALVFPALKADAEDERYSYLELDAAANRLAHQLLAAGVGHGQMVGLCLDRSAEMVIAQLAIQKVGGAYVPLDPSYPADRLTYMIKDAGLTHCVANLAFERLLPEGMQSVLLDAQASEIAAQPSTRTGIDVDCRARMYVIYTSGSTGRPKGVELEHRSVSNFLTSMAREPGLSAGESLLALTTLSFDISVLETMLPLVVGATLIVAPREATTDGGKLIGLLERLDPSMMQATPATWNLLLKSAWDGAPKLKVLCGGEALKSELADALIGRVGEMWNMYGPTETTIWSTLKRVRAEDELITIGRPIANTRVYILDSDLAVAPVGVPGELWIAGDGLARGYLERPEMTAERFVPEPFHPGSRMYRTGDLGRWRFDGELECLGRVDSQVKLRGYRIELGEIESVLVEDDSLVGCCCVVREDTPGDQRLVAYCVLTAGASLDDAALRERARGKLPSYMLPSAFVVAEELPLTPNGKLDRNALLAAGEKPSGATNEEYVPPRTGLERAIAAIWGKALQLERVSVNVNFFDQGGHSLLLAEVHASLQQELGAKDLSIIELFQYPTVESLAAYLKPLGIRA